MKAAASLPARIVYMVAAIPLGGAAGFYLIMILLPMLVGRYPQLEPSGGGPGMFNLAVGVGAGIAYTAGLVALTLPWVRHRKRPGRGWRTAVSLVMVAVASAVFADLEHWVVYDLLFAAWLAYTMSYTFVRYGVIDQARHRPSRYY